MLALIVLLKDGIALNRCLANLANVFECLFLIV